MMPATFSLTRNARGLLVFVDAQGTVHEGAVPVRAFPITAPDEGLSLVSPDGHELLWIADLADLSDTQRPLCAAALAARGFMPVIQRIVSVPSFATPSTWTVETDRGSSTFVLKGEEDIRRLAPPNLLVSDSHGIHYLIRDASQLDKASRKLLDRFF